MNEVVAIVLGAVLAVGGGAASDEIRAFRERRRELKSIKIALIDELGEIEETIKKMHEVWEKSKVFHPAYIGDLQSNTQACDGLRQRFFLITNEALRKRVVAFYKKLKDTAKESEGRLGTLADTQEAIAEQTAFESSFQKLGDEAKSIKVDLEK